MVISLSNYELAALVLGLLVTLTILQRRRNRSHKDAVKDLTIQRLSGLIAFTKGEYTAVYNGFLFAMEDTLYIKTSGQPIPILHLKEDKVECTGHFNPRLFDIFGLDSTELAKLFLIEGKEIAKKSYIYTIKSIISRLRKGELKPRGSIIIKQGKIAIS